MIIDSEIGYVNSKYYKNNLRKKFVYSVANHPGSFVQFPRCSRIYVDFYQ